MANHSPRTSAQNTPDIALIIDSEAISMMRISVEVLDQLEALFLAIRDCAQAGSARKPSLLPDAALLRIKTLASLGGDIATDRAGLIGCGRERFESEHLPVILAAMEGGAK